ncbi:hypothetical protein [Microlunatus speluncae]|uniref:hypothetical protein n=1 Tax=Microlunatus speluncae TaxID=2594267 RepID=UPI0012663250|nr:hypothetical protein [Microlunatus speluncae]
MGIAARMIKIAVVAIALTCSAAVAAAGPRPVEYVVSETPGFLPEGIAIDSAGTMIVGSDGTGAINRGDVGNPRLTSLPVDGLSDRGKTLGVHLGPGGEIWSVGRDQLTVHTPRGRLIHRRSAAGGPLGPSDLNDLVVTRTAVYVTDWANPIVYRATVRGGRVGPLEPWLDLRPAFPGFPAQFWLLNGITASADGRTLLIASNGTEAVWRVEVAGREISRLDLGDQSFGADGLELVGSTLYGVLNYGAPHGVYLADLDPALRRGTITHRLLTDAAGKPFALPSTVAVHRCRLYVVNSQLDQRPGRPPYTVSALPDPAC